jgi:hypothetical protein
MRKHHQRFGLVMLRISVGHHRRRHHWWQRHHGRHDFVVVQERTLTPNGADTMNPVTVAIGHVVNLAIIYLDQQGNPMLVTPTPDSPPVWTDSPVPAGCCTFVSTGSTAVDTAVAAGADTVGVTVIVGGVTFTASLGVVVSAAAQVLTSIEIGSTVV